MPANILEFLEFFEGLDVTPSKHYTCAGLHRRREERRQRVLVSAQPTIAEDVVATKPGRSLGDAWAKPGRSLGDAWAKLGRCLGEAGQHDPKPSADATYNYKLTTTACTTY
jgi:hypothetical protein